MFSTWNSLYQSYKLFDQLVYSHKMHTMPTLLAGDMQGMKGLRIKGMRVELQEFGPIAEKKLNNCKAYAEIYPEVNLVFVGDNGQGDVVAGQRMLKLKIVKHVFIHLIKPLEQTWGYNEHSDDWTSLGIIFFSTYVGAAVAAFKRKLIHAFGLHRIANESLQEFKILALTCKFSSYQCEQDFLEQLLQDIRAANELLPFELQIDNLELNL